jgi:hypothetical protein
MDNIKDYISNKLQEAYNFLIEGFFQQQPAFVYTRTSGYKITTEPSQETPQTTGLEKLLVFFRGSKGKDPNMGEEKNKIWVTNPKTGEIKKIDRKQKSKKERRIHVSVYNPPKDLKLD